MMRYILSGALALLAALQPAESACLLPACAAAILTAVPGWIAALFLKRSRDAWAVWLSFADMLPVALPVSVFCAMPELALFAVCHHLTGRFLGGWLLRRAGIRSEKNFTLILAYRQTIRHCSRFPQEMHPRENPLFQPARNAQNALAELLPLTGILAGTLLRKMGLRLAAAPIPSTVSAALILLLTACALYPRRGFRLPSLRCLPMALLRLLLMGISAYWLGNVFPAAGRYALLLCALLPLSGLSEDLRIGGAAPSLCRAVEDASCWSGLLWALSGAILFTI